MICLYWSLLVAVSVFLVEEEAGRPDAYHPKPSVTVCCSGWPTELRTSEKSPGHQPALAGWSMPMTSQTVDLISWAKGPFDLGDRFGVPVDSGPETEPAWVVIRPLACAGSAAWQGHPYFKSPKRAKINKTSVKETRRYRNMQIKFSDRDGKDGKGDY